jgi:hypothetical protein
MEESAPVINSLIKSIEDKLPAEDVENVISMVNTIVHTYEDKLQQGIAYTHLFTHSESLTHSLTHSLFLLQPTRRVLP